MHAGVEEWRFKDPAPGWVTVNALSRPHGTGSSSKVGRDALNVSSRL